MRVATRTGALGAAMLLCAALPGAARADGTLQDKAAAELLYDQAKKLMASGDFNTACPKLAESERLDPGVGTLLTLGECYEHLDHKASAWAAFREAAALAKTKRQSAREKVARTRAAALEGKLSKLVIEVPAASEVAGILVKRDDEPVSKALWGTPLPIDGGKHAILVTAPGRKEWSSTVNVDKDGQLFTVSVPALSPEEAPSAGGTGDKAAGPAQRGGGAQRAVGLVAMGLGVGGIGAGVGLGLVALSKHDEAQAHCAPTCAAGGGAAIQSDAKNFALGSTIGFTAGGVLAAGGLVLFLLAPSSKAQAVGVAPVVSGEFRGAVVSGTF